MFLLAGAAPAGAAADPEAARDLLKRSIAIPTVEGRGKVPELTALYAGTLKAAGYKDADIVITPMGETATMAVTLQGRDSRLKPILLIGHMDVVEAKAADWTRDPFVPVEEQGFIFGRGSQDNKYDVTMMVTTMAQLKRDGFRPRRTVILLLSGDEETHSETTKVLATRYPNAELLLNGDAGGGYLNEETGKPDFYALQAGEKTYADFQIEVTDEGGHSSRPDATNAIAILAAAVARIGAYRFAPQANELTRTSLALAAQKVGGDIGAAMGRFAKDPGDGAAADIISKSPEYIGQVRTTCVPTLISGGHATNALPQRATANINCRIFPGVAVATVQAELIKVVADPAARVTVVDSPLASDASPLRPDVLAAVGKAVHARYPGLPIVPAMSPGATDSIFFRAAGIPSYGVASLFHKASDDLAHGLDERVPSGDIKDALLQWDILIRELAK
jgi:acetylornithine deacetylase/succinyl-diaminopimelate desuccinylase-like protein